MRWAVQRTVVTGQLTNVSLGRESQTKTPLGLMLLHPCTHVGPRTVHESLEGQGKDGVTHGRSHVVRTDEVSPREVERYSGSVKEEGWVEERRWDELP